MQVVAGHSVFEWQENLQVTGSQPSFGISLVSSHSSPLPRSMIRSPQRESVQPSARQMRRLPSDESHGVPSFLPMQEATGGPVSGSLASRPSSSDTPSGDPA